MKKLTRRFLDSHLLPFVPLHFSVATHGFPAKTFLELLRKK